MLFGAWFYGCVVLVVDFCGRKIDNDLLQGNPGCWGGDFNFERCCIDANEPQPDPLVTEVAVLWTDQGELF